MPPEKEVDIKGLVIAGTKSGCGKTTVTLGLLASLARRGIHVAPFKVGPDFIDPGHHTAITRAVSRNLDGWMLSKAYNLECFRKNAENADVAVIEGVMGLFDGYDGKTEAGSTAQMAKWLGLPVILVVDAKSMARSAAALVQGFERFDKDLRFAGVLFNNVGSEGHLRYLKDALEHNVNMPCLGGVVHEKEIAIPERHLGLVTRNDHFLSDEAVSMLADTIDKATDIDTLLDSLPEISAQDDLSSPHVPNKTPLVRIGVAVDNAFCFYYQDNFDILKACGAELVYFSPMKDNDLPENLDGIYFGGGYPELFARQLADNVNLRNQIREKSIDGMPIYGECGGFMYLCREISDTEGNTYPMTNCFPFATRMFPRLKALGYREIAMAKDTIIGKRGQTVRGHEFHYSEMTGFSQKIETVYSVSARAGIKKNDEGYQIANTLGSYIHLHFGSQPDAARHFMEACLQYKNTEITNSK
ncbi:Cobyrinate a,c-diamide synthase [Desulfonema magnum]|uniref:Cobyrinate a,c-diamide synthase n=1 Tax=Desulfonema magnum TaxID=45655 RepID=A0A975BQ65_9BACT|nr:Cobyrinate a,c-diamide synthase [Desulfonema magnum]